MARRHEWLTVFQVFATVLLLVDLTPAIGAPAAGPPAPAVLGWSPGLSQDLPLSAPITIYFNHMMDTASLDQAWSLQPETPGRLSADPISLTFTPTHPLRAKTTYHLTIGTVARDARGIALARPYHLDLQTGSGLAVQSETPAAGTSGVSANGVIAVTFNRPMVPLEGLSSGNPSPRGWRVTIDPATPGNGYWLGTSTWVFRPTNGLQPSSHYTVVVRGIARDVVGEPLDRDVRWSFQTATPEIVGVAPPRSARYADPRTPIEVAFSQSMDRASVERAFSLSVGQARVSGSFIWKGDVLYFRPARPLDSSRPYRVMIGAAARSENGRATLRRSLSWRFTVAPPPRIIGSDPEPGQTMSGQVELYLSAPMNQQSLDRHLTITPHLGQQYTSLYPPDPNSGEGADVYSIGGDFQPSASYTVTISGGVRDRYGRPLPGPNTLHFKTPRIAPSVAFYGMPNASAIEFSAGRSYDAPIQVINVPKVHYTLIRTSYPDVAQFCFGCPQEYQPYGKAVRRWTVATAEPLNKVVDATVHLAQANGSPLAPGLYWLGAQAPYGLPGSGDSEYPPESSEIVVVANVSVTEKMAGNGTLVWVTSADTGKPLAGASVRLYSSDGSLVTAGTTDGHGLHMFRTVTNQQQVSAVVDDGTHYGLAAASWPSNTQPIDLLANPLRPCCPYSSNGTYAYTDRPIYRPGQTVHFRALLWRDNDGVYALYGPKRVHVTANDSTGHVLYLATLHLDRFGAVRGSFRLKPNVSTGPAWVSVSSPQQNLPGATASFSIAEYRTPDLLTSVASAAPSYVQSQTMHLTVHVKYVFGQPASQQRVSWAAYAQPNFVTPPGYDNYQFYDWESLASDQSQMAGPSSQFGTQIAHGAGTTDGSGKLAIALPVNLSKDPIDQTVTVEATTSDIARQSVSGRVAVAAYKAEYAIGLLPAKWTVAASETETVDVVTVRQDGTPVPGRNLTARIYKRTYSTRLAVQYGQTYWKSIPHDTLLSIQTLITDASGHATLRFTPETGGEYRIVVDGVDALGNAVHSATSIDASAAGFSDWGQSDNTSIPLKPDKTTYSVGDVAHILVPSPFDNATALVTLERGNIRMARVEQLPTNSSSIAIPITLDDLPNVFVTVTLYRGWRNGSPPEWRYGVANLHVNVAPKHLIVRLSQRASHLHPGDRATYTVTATDSNGRPVSAQLSLALVDTAVLALQPDTGPDMLTALYSDRSLGVQTVSDGTISVDHLTQGPSSPIQSNEARNGPIAAAPAARFGPVKGGGGGPPPSLYVRSHFADTAYWRGALQTDAQGKATVSFRLPDNATTWRLDARGLTASQAVGQAHLETVASQDLVLRPTTPRFFTVGDSLHIGTALNNNLDRPVGVTVSLEASGLTSGGNRPVHVTLTAHGVRVFLWPVSVGVASPARILLRAVPDSRDVRGDAVALRIPVHPPLTDETVAMSGQVFDHIRQYVVLPRNAVTRPGALTVQVSAALTSGLGSFLRDFQPQPYESNDDVANRLLVASALWSLPRTLDNLSLTSYRGLPTVKRYAAEKLVQNQYPDGGWPWFNEAFEQSDPFITADVVQALAAANMRSSSVRQALARGQTYLLNNLSLVPSAERAHLLLVLALSGRPDRSVAESLYRNTIARAHLDVGALADLGRALALSGDRAKGLSVAATLDGRAVASATGAHWEASAHDLWSQPVYAITDAALGTLLSVEPSDPFVPAAVRWLMLSRHDDTWDCSRDAAQIVATLASYARLAHEGDAAYRYRGQVSGLDAMAGSYTPENQRHVATLAVPAASLGPGVPRLLDISRDGNDGSLGLGPLYYVARLRYYLPAGLIAPRNEGIAVSRTYLDVHNRPVTQVRMGDIVKVRLTIKTSQTLEYLDVEDPLPSGLEAIDGSLATSQQGLFRPAWDFPYYSSVGQLDWYLNHTDLRDDRVSLFAGYLPSGTYTYTYLAQATVPGTYAVAPTHVSETFFPEVFGRSAGQSFTVK